MIRLLLSFLSEHKDFRDILMWTSGGVNLLGFFNSVFAWINWDAVFTITERALMVLSALSVTAITVYSKIRDERRKQATFERENRQDEERHREEMKDVRSIDSARTPRT